MKLSIDCDGVISRFDRAVVYIAGKLWPGRLPETYQPTTWGYTDVFSEADWTKIWQEIDQTFNFWQFVEPYADNLTALRDFLRTHQNQEVYHVTSRKQTAGSPVALQTQIWLMLNNVFPERNYHAILPVAQVGYKREVMRSLGIQYSIDDYGPTVERCQTLKGHAACLLRRPWNRDSKAEWQVDTLQQFFDEIYRQPS